MLKKLVTLLVLAVLALNSAGSAWASFADLELIRIYYDRSGAEIATDLGQVKDLTAGGTTTIPGSFGSLSTGYAVYFSLDRTTGVNQLWASGSSGAPSVILGGSTGLTSLKNGTIYVYSWFNDHAVGSDYTGLASDNNSYAKKLSATQGWLANSITTRANTEAAVNDLIGTGSGSVQQLLYFWNNAVTTFPAEKVGVPAAVITTLGNGSTRISPPPPGAPTINAATAGNGQVTVEFSAAPVYPGAGAVTGYAVTATLADGSSNSPQGSDLDAGTTELNHVVTGLQNDTTYNFSVTATNVVGSGPASAASAVASATPTAPTVCAVTYDGNGSTGGSAPTDPGSPYTSGSTVIVSDAGTLFRTGYSFAGWNTAADGSGTGYEPGETFTIAAETHLYAQWSESYTVSYAGNGNTGGAAPADPASPYTSGATVTVLGADTLIKTGYSFAGWNTQADGSGTGYAAGATFAVAADTTLYAQWNALSTYGVTYDGNANTGGAAPVDPGSYLAGATATVLTAGTLVKTGYSFNGWNTLVDGSGTGYAPGATFTVAGDTTLHARWTINNYTVSFDSNGGDAVSSQVVPYGTVAASPTTPAKNGNSFAGWYADSALTTAFDFSTPITADTTLYAGWTLNGYSVTPSVISGSGSISPATPQSVPYGGSTTFTIAPADGYTASVGGTCRGTRTGNTYTTEPIVTDCTVQAYFSQNSRTVTVTVGANGSVTPLGAFAVAEGAPLVLTVSADTGYAASVTSSCGGSLSGNSFAIASVTTDCTIAATFTIKSYTVSTSTGGTGGSITGPTAPVPYGGSATVTITPAIGYHLATLTDNGNDVKQLVSGGGYTITSLSADHTVTASFAIDTKTVTASVTGANGSVTPESSSVDYGGSVALSIAPATGHHVGTLTDNGIDVKSAVNNGLYSISAIKENHAVVASFAPDVKTVTASVSGDHGTITPTSSAVNYGGGTTLSVVADTGYEASVTSSCGGSLAGNIFTIASVTVDCTVTASFGVKNFTVSAAVAGGQGQISQGATVPYGGSATLAVTPATGYHLASLTDNGNDVTGAISNGLYSITNISADHSVSAGFAIDTHTVTASVNGANGAITPASSSIDYGSSATLSITPATGYHLGTLTDNGRDVTGAVSNGLYGIAGVKENHAVVAIFRGITFTVSPGAGANGAIAPAAPQTVDAGKSFSFTVTPDAGYQIAGVTGCGGSLNGNTYSTAGAVGDCAVSATFIAIPTLSGDLNDDKVLDLADALLALQYAVGVRTKTAAAVAKGDVAPIVSGQSAPDHKLDIADAVALLRRSVGQLSW